jgi:glycosyltransferase involved in cell wall biosynthesis
MPARTVYLYVGRSTHPIYREQLHAAPDGFAYRTDHPELADEGAATRLVQGRGDRFAGLRQRAEVAALRVLGQTGHVRRVRGSGVALRPGDDLIHSTELLLRDAPLPYVADFEQIECFTLYQHVALQRGARRRLVEAIADGRCRALLAWSDWARDGALRALGAGGAARVGEKIVTVVPSIRPQVDAPRQRAAGGPLRVLFIGTKFYEKGAIEAVRALARARATHDVTLDLVSYVPDEWAPRLAAQDGLTVHQPGGHELVRRLYGEADVLLFPSHMDTFGYVIMEANAYGLPVLGPAHQAIPELIADGDTGLLFGSENPLYGADGLGRFPHALPSPKAYMNALREPSDAYVDTIAAQLCRLADDADLHGRLAAGALERVRTGLFSVARRQERLAAIYGAAVGAADVGSPSAA